MPPRSLRLVLALSAAGLPAFAGEAPPPTAAPPPVRAAAPAVTATPAAAAPAPAATPANAPASAGPNPEKTLAAAVSNPRGVAVDRAGNLYFVNYDDGSVIKITPAGSVTTLVSATATPMLSGASGMGVDAAGNLFVAEADGASIRKITPAGETSILALQPPPAPPAAPDAPAAPPVPPETLTSPTGVALDRDGNLYVCDNGAAVIRKITPAGVMTTLAGKSGQIGSADGTGADARFSMPRGIAVDAQGNVYVADEGTSTIRKVTPAGVVTTLAGKAGEQGQTDGTGADATFAAPRTLTVAADGTVYVADTDNHCIRKITPAGVVTILAGQGMQQPGITDGTGSEARFAGPRGVAVDGAGNVYVADSENNLIRRISPAGVVTTVAGPAPAP